MCCFSMYWLTMLETLQTSYLRRDVQENQQGVGSASFTAFPASIRVVPPHRGLRAAPGRLLLDSLHGLTYFSHLLSNNLCI